VSLKMFRLSYSLNCTWNNYNICKKLFPATSVVSRNHIVNFNWKVPVLGKCHILSCRGGDHLSGIQYWHQYKLKYKENVLSDTPLFCHTTMHYMFGFIKTIVRLSYYRSLFECCMRTYVFQTSVIKVPDDCSDEPKHIPHCCMALECCVWQYTFSVFQLQLKQWDESEYTNTAIHQYSNTPIHSPWRITPTHWQLFPLTGVRRVQQNCTLREFWTILSEKKEFSQSDVVEGNINETVQNFTLTAWISPDATVLNKNLQTEEE
jgi:hypothetical protein